jgi:spore coat protein CotH
MNIRGAVLGVCCVILFAASACADAFTDALFDKSRLHEVRITMAASDWAALRANYQADTRYDATLTFDGETIANSTIRSRGSGTRNPFKPGLRVDFYRKISTQRFHGFRTLIVDNMYNDPSFLREQLAFRVFEEMAIRVPRESYARLTVNGEYWGLYAIIEPVDEVFVKTHVDAGGGNLFDYEVPPLDPVNPVGWDFTLSRGTTIAGYVPEPFDPETNEDTLDGTALLDFIRTVTEGTDETFVDRISGFIDPRAILTYYAVETATAEVDGLTSFFGVNNFYLYQLQGTRRFLFIPWDHDFNFTSPTHDIYFGIRRNRLIERLLADREMNAFYRQTLQSIVNRFVNPAWMFPRIDAMVALIRDSVLADTKRREGNFDEAVAQVRSVIEARPANVDAQLDAKRRRAVRRF